MVMRRSTYAERNEQKCGNPKLPILEASKDPDGHLTVSERLLIAVKNIRDRHLGEIGAQLAQCTDGADNDRCEQNHSFEAGLIPIHRLRPTPFA